MRTGVRKDYLKGSRRHGRGHSPYPFDRLLASRLGRRWDEVFSEFCSEFDHRSLAGYSFHRDLKWHVATDCWVGAETGTVYRVDRWGGDAPVNNEFYVHPFTGVLCWADPIIRPKEEKEVVHHDLGDGKSYDKVDGVWYFLHNYTIEHEGFTSIPPSYVRPGRTVLVDGVEQYIVKWTEHVNIKHQLSRKELRTLGLANAGAPYGQRCAVCGFDCKTNTKCVHAIKAEAAAGRTWRLR
jgi:hypothetical protein